MKKKILVFMLIMLAVIVTGCFSGGAGDLLYQEKSDTWIFLTVEPLGSDYRAYCMTNHKDDTRGEDVFNDAEVKINGEVLGPCWSSEDDEFQGHFAGSGFDFSAGDIVTIYLSHDLFGEIKENIEVPNSVTSTVELSADITQWVNGEVDSITLDWEASNANTYRVGVVRYYDDKVGSSFSSITTDETNYTFSSSWLEDSDGNKADEVEFKIIAVNKHDLLDFYGSSRFEIQAPAAKVVSDLN